MERVMPACSAILLATRIPSDAGAGDYFTQEDYDKAVEELEQMAARLGLTGWVKNLENGDVQAEIQGYESRIRFLLKFMRSLKRIKIEKLENKPCSPKQGETEFKIV